MHPSFREAAVISIDCCVCDNMSFTYGYVCLHIYWTSVFQLNASSAALINVVIKSLTD